MREINGFSAPGQPIEIVTIRLAVVVARAKGAFDGPGNGQFSVPASSSTAAEIAVWFNATQPVSTRLIPREQLRRGELLTGPAVISQMDATVLIPPAYTARADEMGNLMIERGPK